MQVSARFLFTIYTDHLDNVSLPKSFRLLFSLQKTNNLVRIANFMGKLEFDADDALLNAITHFKFFNRPLITDVL